MHFEAGKFAQIGREQILRARKVIRGNSSESKRGHIPLKQLREAAEKAKEAPRPKKENDLNEIFPNHTMREVGTEVRSVIAAILGMSERLAVTQVRKQLKVQAETQDGATQREPLRSTEVPIRIYAATSIAAEDKIDDIDGIGRYNRAILLIAADSDDPGSRTIIMQDIRETLTVHMDNRDSILSRRANSMHEENRVTIPQLYVRMLVPTRDERRALKIQTDGLADTEGEVSGVFYDMIDGKDRDNTVLSTIVARNPGLPQLHIYLGLMPSEELDGPLSVHGRNFTCIAEINQTTLTGSPGSIGYSGDGDF